MSRRVVVTGIGLVSSLGIGTEQNWEALSCGRSGIATSGRSRRLFSAIVGNPVLDRDVLADRAVDNECL